MIRKALASDCLNLAALSIQVWLHTYAVNGVRSQLSHYALSTFNEAYFADLLTRESVDIQVFEDGSHLIGFIVVDLESTFESRSDSGFEIVTLYVSQHFHGQGVGRKLIQAIEHLYGAPFWLSVWVNNLDAIGFYNRLGFETIGELSFALQGEQHRNHILACTGLK